MKHAGQTAYGGDATGIGPKVAAILGQYGLEPDPDAPIPVRGAD